MPSLLDIKRRIASVQSTQKITRAMKMVAAAKLRRAQEAIVRTRPYALRMRDLVSGIALRADRDIHPLLRHGRGAKVGLIVVTSDRGLCGGFNHNIVEAALGAVKETFRGREVALTVVGRKGVDVLRRRDGAIRAAHIDVYDKPAFRAAGEIMADLVDEYAKGETHELHCVYNEFKSAIAQKVTVERLLPFEPADDKGVVPIDYVYEPSVESVLDGLLAKHMQVQMHRILHESTASEHGARMTAMDAATKNAGDVIDRLRLKYNRARQDAITKELIEVISGAEAL
ncbi:MAG TPA: ATP synthase F1 subunit gamma [Candidatus Hydrogenedentes bacterium]|nr:ATP synthase F1 subunit gamma [Candidatus Hydrogenedentota bacterium]